MFDIQQGVGFAFDFAKLPPSTVNRLLSAKWYGRNFSSRIWRNRGLVANQASKIIIEGVLSGQSIPQMSKALLEQTYTKNMYNAARLIRTEVNYFSNQGALTSYKEAELDKYEFCATLDLRTSKICGERDGNIYPLDSAVVGENYPPMHPYCRSCAIPIIEIEGLKRMDKRRMRNPETGKNEIVDNMNFADWRKKYVENSPKLSEAKEFTGGNKSDIISIGRDNVGIDIQIDKFTPCLIERKTGVIFNTKYTLADKAELKQLQKQGWNFNWAAKDLVNTDIYKLTLTEDNKIQGLVALTDFQRDKAIYVNIAESAPWNIGKEKEYEGVGGHLFAIAAQVSNEKGYGGFLFMDAKNIDLVKYYSDKFGAKLIGIPHPYRMCVDEDAAKQLTQIYTLKGE